MNDNTINNDMTMSGATGTLLAGRYRVVRQLGQGGMGSVWLAEDTKLDGFKVAIKMLPSVLVNNKRAYAQVKAEALVSLKLSHSNIVAVRAFEEEGGNPFLVMDYIDGQTLDDYLAEKGKLSEDETVKLLKPVAAALDYAHTQGVVHRDVKPGNVMIRRDGTPFVLDFGIAREIQETMTRVTGKLSSGTLLYMSPEQLHGVAPKPAQDVYSFAAMVYECLMGHPPFSRGQIEYQIEHDAPEPLPEHVAICRSVMAGLKKLPESRPSMCVGVIRCVSNVSRQRMGNRSVARPRIVVVRRDETERRSWTRLVPVAVIVVVLAMLVGLVVKRTIDAERARRVETERRLSDERRAADEQRQKIEMERKLREAAERREQEIRGREAEQARLLEEEKKARRMADEGKRTVDERKNTSQEITDEIVQDVPVGRTESLRDAFDGISVLGPIKHTYLPFSLKGAFKIPRGWRMEFYCAELKDDYGRNGRVLTACVGEEIGHTGWVAESYTPKTEKRVIEGGNGLTATVDVSEVRVKRKSDGKTAVLSVSRSKSASMPVDFSATLILRDEDGDQRELLAYAGVFFVHNQNHFNVVGVSLSGVEIKAVASGVSRLIRPENARDEGGPGQGNGEMATVSSVGAEKELRLVRSMLGADSEIGWAIAGMQWQKALDLLGEINYYQKPAIAEIVNDEVWKVEMMSFAQQTLMARAKGHAFHGKLKGYRLSGFKFGKLVVESAKITKEYSWPDFCQECPGCLNELINSYIVSRKGTNKQDSETWAKAMLGAAFIMRTVCVDVSGALERSEFLMKVAFCDFAREPLKRLFPEIAFPNAER